MATSPLSFRIAQAIGLTGAAWLSGNIAALSLITIPALLTSRTQDSIPPRTLARQWHSIFQIGKTQNPPIAAISASSFAYLAYSLRAVPGMSRLYGMAALLTIGIVPWTILVMNPTNGKLIAKAEGGGKGEAEEREGREVGELLRKWEVLNGVRSVFPLLGSAVALVAILG